MPRQRNHDWVWISVLMERDEREALNALVKAVGAPSRNAWVRDLIVKELERAAQER